jgi:hypothetical protein
MMEPVGLHPNQAVTVTVSFPARWAGAPVKLGLYDGGQAGPAAPPGQDIIYISNPGVPIPNVSVSGTLQFDFQAGSILGLYRVLLTVGSEQYLLSFYAGRPQALPTPTPVPTPNLVPRDN